MATTYLVRKKPDGSVFSLIRVCDDGAIEYMSNGRWLPEGNAFYVYTGEIGDEISLDEAKEVARQFGGTIDETSDCR